MRKSRAFLILFLLIPIVSAIPSEGFSEGLKKSPSLTGSATKCFPEYSCGEWSACKDGLKSRTCSDSKCNHRDIIERDFCEIELQGCTPKIKCSEWSSCIYTDKVEDLLGGKINFGGYKTRLCTDENRCSDSIMEERVCEESYDLKLEEIEVCGEKYLLASDANSNKEVAKINLESWKNKKLDIVFSQGETIYCPVCYNGVKDSGEQRIDCGGECKPCKESNTLPIIMIVSSLWILSLVFAALSIKESNAIYLFKSGQLYNLKRSITDDLRK